MSDRPAEHLGQHLAEPTSPRMDGHHHPAPLSDAALRAFESALGSGHVQAGEAASGHADPYAFVDPLQHRPAAVVQPSSTDELRAVLAIAREHRLHLWTVSTGENLGYGGAAPRRAGAVVVDLQRMNRVLEVNEELGDAAVEPGLRLLDLHAHLQQQGHRLAMSVPDTGWGSLIGNGLLSPGKQGIRPGGPTPQRY